MGFKLGEYIKYKGSLFFYNGMDCDDYHLLVENEYCVGLEGANSIRTKNIEDIKKINQTPVWVEYIGREVYVWNSHSVREVPEKRVMVSVIDGKCHCLFEGQSAYGKVTYPIGVWDHWKPIPGIKTITLTIVEGSLVKIRDILDTLGVVISYE